MRLVKECLRIIWECQYRITKNTQMNPPLKFWMIENPATGFLRWFLGRPVFEYNPFEYGENYRKPTAIWGLFNMPKKPLLFNPILKGRSIIDLTYRERDKEKRMQIRSMCCPGFAKAFFEANQ